MTNIPKVFKVVIADHHPLVIYGFRMLFHSLEGYSLIGEASNGQELIALSKELKPDIIITDIKMAVIDGIEVSKVLMREMPALSIICLSLTDDDHLVNKMLDAGAKGFLLKTAHPDEILSALDAVMNGETYICQETTSLLVNPLNGNNTLGKKKQVCPHFSNREIEVIKLICSEFSNKEIAQKLFVAIRTVEWYRKQIQEKLDVKTIAGIIVYAIKNNIC